MIDIEAGDADVLACGLLAARVCALHRAGLPAFPSTAEAHAIATEFEMQVATSAAGLRRLFGALRQDPERKTVVIVSAGLMANDRIGGRPDVTGLITTVGEDAARVNATIYVLHMDSSFLEAFSAANGGGPPTSLLREQGDDGGGLERPRRHRRRHAAARRAGQRRPGVSTHPARDVGVLPPQRRASRDKDRDGRPHFISVRGEAARRRRPQPADGHHPEAIESTTSC